jgi:hypothetical protein
LYYPDGGGHDIVCIEASKEAAIKAIYNRAEKDYDIYGDEVAYWASNGAHVYALGENQVVWHSESDVGWNDAGLPAENWIAVRDLFELLIVKAPDWENADIVEEPEGMAKIFKTAYPEKSVWMEDMRLALHDLNVPFERNEHNNKFYYLAKWK